MDASTFMTLSQISVACMQGFSPLNFRLILSNFYPCSRPLIMLLAKTNNHSFGQMLRFGIFPCLAEHQLLMSKRSRRSSVLYSSYNTWARNGKNLSKVMWHSDVITSLHNMSMKCD